MASNIGPVKQAFVKALRDITALKAAVGSDGFHEGIAPPNTQYPFVVYTMVVSSRSHTFAETQALVRSIFDILVVSGDQVEAHNLDQLILEGLEDKSFEFGAGGQSTLLCRRTNDLSSVDVDDAGNKVYQVGGVYTIWVDGM